MTRTDLLLVLLMEECSEVAQRCSKALRFGLLEVQPNQLLNNSERILQEYTDLVTVMMLLNRICNNELRVSEDAMEKKRLKIERYLEYSKQCGVLGKNDRRF